MIKVIGGTRQTSHICFSCSACLHIKSMPESNDSMVCQRFGGRIKNIVVECSGFKLKSEALQDTRFKEMAILLDLSFKGEPIWSKNGRKYPPTLSRRKRSSEIAITGHIQ
jgi:hypothetical protein